jgi:hypothetical protein
LLGDPKTDSQEWMESMTTFGWSDEGRGVRTRQRAMTMSVYFEMNCVGGCPPGPCLLTSVAAAAGWNEWEIDSMAN